MSKIILIWIPVTAILISCVASRPENKEPPKANGTNSSSDGESENGNRNNTNGTTLNHGVRESSDHASHPPNPTTAEPARRPRSPPPPTRANLPNQADHSRVPPILGDYPEPSIRDYEHLYRPPYFPPYYPHVPPYYPYAPPYYPYYYPRPPPSPFYDPDYPYHPPFPDPDLPEPPYRYPWVPYWYPYGYVPVIGDPPIPEPMGGRSPFRRYPSPPGAPRGPHPPPAYFG